MRCSACEMVTINGVPCHETGCPEAWRDYDRECAWCGTRFRPENRYQFCCDPSCDASYHGREPDEGPNYRDFAPANDDDPEAYAEMCREDAAGMS
jgi:hypothetical protein